MELININFAPHTFTLFQIKIIIFNWPPDKVAYFADKHLHTYAPRDNVAENRAALGSASPAIIVYNRKSNIWRKKTTSTLHYIVVDFGQHSIYLWRNGCVACLMIVCYKLFELRLVTELGQKLEHHSVCWMTYWLLWINELLPARRRLKAVSMVTRRRRRVGSSVRQ